MRPTSVACRTGRRCPRELAAKAAIGRKRTGRAPLECDPWNYPEDAKCRLAFPPTGATELPNLDLHQPGRRPIGRHPHRWTRGRGVDFQITHLVIRRRHEFRRLPGVHVDAVKAAA